MDELIYHFLLLWKYFFIAINYFKLAQLRKKKNEMKPNISVKLLEPFLKMNILLYRRRKSI